ncbi:hypothetical protein [Prochlorococcus sp. MIT 1223]|nr:hypothetical protein [Prochlorococcus sp. MIT 1223]
MSFFREKVTLIKQLIDKAIKVMNDKTAYRPIFFEVSTRNQEVQRNNQ